MVSGSFSAAFGDIQRFLERHVEGIENQASDALLEAGDAGHDRMLEIIETTTSATGEARAGRGGHPGRIDTGNMIDSVMSDNIIKGSGDNRSYITTWGWLNNFEDYFGLQDQWPGLPAGAMNAIQQSYIEAREKLFEELSK